MGLSPLQIVLVLLLLHGAARLCFRFLQEFLGNLLLLALKLRVELVSELRVKRLEECLGLLSHLGVLVLQTQIDDVDEPFE